MPSRIVPLAVFPTTDRGKLDRKKLPLPTAADDARDARGDGPRGDLEVALAGIFKEVLGAAFVGRDDDFEALGGNSLLAGRATNAIRRLDGASSVPGTAIYKHATVATLAPVVAAARAAASSKPVSAAAARPSQGAALDPTRPAALILQALGAGTVLALRYLDWPAWYLLWCVRRAG